MKNIAAALIFFTRLPFWRIKSFNVPSEYYKQVINYWAVIGWLTGGIMCITLWLAAHILPYSFAIILAILSRLLITGGLHEDGLADFFDGFGGGTTKERILAIMKDSHIGTYGVIALIFYFFSFYTLMCSLPINITCIVLLVADPLCKFVSSQITRFLTYARTAETSKAKTVYDKMPLKALIISGLFALLPLLLLPNIWLISAILFPIITFFSLISLMKKKINGYTGDCCGAMFLLCELSFWIGIAIVVKLSFLN